MRDLSSGSGKNHECKLPDVSHDGSGDGTGAEIASKGTAVTKQVESMELQQESALQKIKKLTEVRTCVIVKAGLFCQLFYVSIIRSADDAL